MKTRITAALLSAALFLCAAFVINSAFGQANGDTSTYGKIYVTDGNPNNVVFYSGTVASGTGQPGRNGDLCVTKTGGFLYIKTGGASSSNWVQVLDTNGAPLFVSSGTVAGNPIYSGTVTFNNVVNSGTGSNSINSGTVTQGATGTPVTTVVSGTGTVTTGTLTVANTAITAGATVLVTPSGTTAGTPTTTVTLSSGTMTVVSGSTADTRVFNYYIRMPH